MYIDSVSLLSISDLSIYTIISIVLYKPSVKFKLYQFMSAILDSLIIILYITTHTLFPESTSGFLLFG